MQFSKNEHSNSLKPWKIKENGRFLYLPLALAMLVARNKTVYARWHIKGNFLGFQEQIPFFVFEGVFFICLFVFGSAAVRVLLSDYLSNQPWREASAVEGISLVCGLALNYAVLAIGTAWTGIDDISIMILSAATGCVALAAGGKLYLSSQPLRHAKKFYSGNHLMAKPERHFGRWLYRLPFLDMELAGLMLCGRLRIQLYLFKRQKTFLSFFAIF